MPLHTTHFTSIPIVEHVGAIPPPSVMVPSRRTALEALEKITITLEANGRLPDQVFDELDILRLFVELR